LAPALIGRLVNELREVAIFLDRIPKLTVSPDPFDDHLLATACAGSENFLVTGDEPRPLSLDRYRGVKIVSVTSFLRMLKP